MRVTEAGLREYLEVFNSTLRETSGQHLPSELWDNLFHLALLPAHIVGYLSTTFGAAIEYRATEQGESEETTLRIEQGSDRIENLFVPIPLGMRYSTPLMHFTGPSCGLSALTLRSGFPFKLETPETSLFLQDVVLDTEPLFTKGISYKFRKHVRYAEVFASNDKDNWSAERAVARAKDEVLAALSEVKRSETKNISISDFISNHKSKTILLLGDYDSEGSERLRRIQSSLTVLGYEPVLIKDIPDFPPYDLSQKVRAIGAIAKFVVIDDSSASGHLTEVEICRRNDWVTILLRAGGRGGSWMTAGASLTSKLIFEQSYNPSDPTFEVTEAAKWAEETLQGLKERFSSLYPWLHSED